MKRWRGLCEVNKELMNHIYDLKMKHPFWGYRRIWAYLRYQMDYAINIKRVHRLIQMHNLQCPKNLKLRAKRTYARSKPKANRPNQLWGIDMTKILLPRSGWVYLHVVIDWFTKKIVGYSVSSRSKTRDWLDALGMAVLLQFPNGIEEERRRNKGLFLVSDNGCQPTSKTFERHCKLLGIKQIFTSYSNPKGNADTERVIRTIKEELVYINEFAIKSEFSDAFKNWVEFYNFKYPHSALKYKSPYQVESEYVNNNLKLQIA